ncbi:Hypothetical protein A7982_06095 [Minicystis rosea]|nr:Hypothetical protein A7982_06095 [Minicystis rosea]
MSNVRSRLRGGLGASVLRTAAVCAISGAGALTGLLVIMAFVGLPPNDARADDEPQNVETTCNHGKIYDAGLCYDRCKTGYKGIGPVCWAECPDGYTDTGALCTKGEIIPKESYTRGAGTPLECGAGEEKDGALCYPACKSGYDGVGPVCWEKCPDGYKDDGALCRRDAHARSADTSKCSVWDKCGLTLDKHCSKCPKGYRNDGCTCFRDAHITTKKSYGRGAGVPLHTCNGGKVEQDGLCYKPCKSGDSGVGPVCWKSCPAGYKDDGALCRKDLQTITKSSYGRGAGTVPPTCATPSFTKPVPPVTDRGTFTMIFASDPQFVRSETEPKCAASDDACTERKSKAANRDQAQAINDVQKTADPLRPGVTGFWPTTAALTRGGGSAISAPKALVINGDLTEDWWPQWVDLLEQTYTLKGSIKWPVYLGLGNHEYDNHWNDAWWREPLYYLSLGSRGAAANARDFMKTMIHCDKVPNFPASSVQSFDKKSLAYSWNVGSYHFVELHNYPTYERKEIEISSSIPWLKTDLAAATAAGRKIVLNFHQYDTESMKADDQDFLQAIAGQNVVAVFTGHVHRHHGYTGKIHGTKIPYFRAGASDYHTFLLAEFGEDYMNVGVIDSTNGAPTFKDPTENDNLRTFAVPPAKR